MTARKYLSELEKQHEETVLDRAVELIKASAQKGQAQAQYLWGTILEAGVQTPGLTVAADKAEAMQWYQKAADQKYAPAAARLALIQTPPVSTEEEQAANDPAKLFYLGRKYYEGKKTVKNVQQAVKFFEKAAALGHARAAFILYEVFEKGEDAPKDIKSALGWLHRAAELGDGEAQYYWAFALLEGFEEDGVKIETDSAEGLKWLSESAKNGYEKAVQELKVIKQLVRPANTAAAPPAPASSPAPEPKPTPAQGEQTPPPTPEPAADRLTTEVNPKVNLVNNSSFEQGEPVGAFATIKAGDGLLPGWQVVRGSIDMLGSYWPASHGGQCLDLHGASGIGAIRQILSTEPGQSYEVLFDMAGDPECGATIRKIRVTAAGQSSDFSFDPKNNSRQQLGWITNKWRFRAREANTVLEFSSLSRDNSLCGPLLDNVIVQKTGD